MLFSRQLVVDAGASHVACGVFSPGSAGRLVLQDFALETLAPDSSQEPGWIVRTAQALGSIAARRKLHGPAAWALPGQLTLTKFIQTPVVAPAQLDKVVQFAASQHIPYPLEAVAWHHEVVATDGPELELLLTAVKLEGMERLCASAGAVGFPVTGAVPSCLALHRAARFNAAAATGPVLLVDIGARSTNLLFVGAGRFFSRTIPLGGNAVTAAVAEELELDFARAEAVKVHVLGRLTAASECAPASAAVHRAVAKFIRRLQLEITRAAQYLEGKGGVMPAAAIQLTGGGSLLSELGPALWEKFGLPVARFDPLARVELSPRARAAGAEAATHLLANLVGLAALPGPGAAGSLLPPVVRAERTRRRRQPVLLAAAALVAVALVPPLEYYHRRATTDAARTADLTARLQPLQAIAARNAANLEKIAAAQRQITVLRGLVEAKANWVGFFADLQSRLLKVEDVWLENLTVVHPPSASPTEAGSGRIATTGSGGPNGPVPAVQLRLTGRLLDTQNPVSKVSPDSHERVKQLLASFAGSRFIAAIGGERFDNAQPGLLRFDVTLAVNPQHPL
jgi:type IV pilus assembly protein PilM